MTILIISLVNLAVVSLLVYQGVRLINTLETAISHINTPGGSSIPYTSDEPCKVYRRTDEESARVASMRENSTETRE